MASTEGSHGGRFADRRQAGIVLAHALRTFADREDVVVLGLPRGGVPVAFEVARALDAPLDVCIVRKLGVPTQPELAMGAIASGGVRVLNEGVVASVRLSDAALEAVTRQEQAELARRERIWRGARPLVPVDGRIVILVDDGLATGATMRAAVMATRARHPARIVVAAPVGAADTCRALGNVADEVVCVSMPAYFDAVGQWYEDFSQTTDEEVRHLLETTMPGSRPDSATDEEPP